LNDNKLKKKKNIVLSLEMKFEFYVNKKKMNENNVKQKKNVNEMQKN
jgi:hypothetical protein